MMNMLRVCVYGLLMTTTLLCTLRCEADVTESKKDESLALPNYSLSPGTPEEIADISEIVKSIKTIKLSSEVADKVGVIFHFFVIDPFSVILADEIAGTISRVNGKGELVWQIRARNDDYRFFQKFTECSFDPLNQRIIVYGEDKVYEYSFDGEPISVEKAPEFDFRQFVRFSAEDIVYSCQGFENYNLIDRPKQLVWTRNGSVKDTYLEEVPYAPKSLIVGSFPEFNWLNGNLYYHATLRDTFYRIDLPNVSAEFTFDFGGSETTDDVMKKKHIRNKLGYIRENNILRVYSLAADDDRVVVSFQKGKDTYVSILDREKEEWLLNHQYLRHEGLNFRSPILYNNGYFLRMIPQYQIDHYAKIPKQATSLPQDWMNEMNELDGEFDELGSKTLYIIEL